MVKSLALANEDIGAYEKGLEEGIAIGRMQILKENIARMELKKTHVEGLNKRWYPKNMFKNLFENEK
jgi:hypothetical protein